MQRLLPTTRFGREITMCLGFQVTFPGFLKMVPSKLHGLIPSIFIQFFPCFCMSAHFVGPSVGT